LSSVLRNAVAGIAVTAGVGSLITIGIMIGVKMAYADEAIGLEGSNEQSAFTFMLEEYKR